MFAVKKQKNNGLEHGLVTLDANDYRQHWLGRAFRMATMQHEHSC